MKKVIVDPPYGWRYGFPKACLLEVFEDKIAFKKWLLASGYPEKDIDFGLQYTRYWEENSEI